MTIGTVSEVYTNNQPANTTTIYRDELCGPPANTTGWRNPGLIHTASFKGMTALAGQKVYYTFGDAATNDFSNEFVLFVPPLAGTQPSTRPTTIGSNDDK